MKKELKRLLGLVNGSREKFLEMKILMRVILSERKLSNFKFNNFVIERRLVKVVYFG